MRRITTTGFRRAAILFAGAMLLALFADAASPTFGEGHGFALSSQSKKKSGKAKAPPAQKAAKPDGPTPRTPFSADDQTIAGIGNIPNARFWADSESEFLAALPTTQGPWLILSAGREDGA